MSPLILSTCSGEAVGSLPLLASTSLSLAEFYCLCNGFRFIHLFVSLSVFVSDFLSVRLPFSQTVFLSGGETFSFFLSMCVCVSVCLSIGFYFL